MAFFWGLGYKCCTRYSDRDYINDNAIIFLFAPILMPLVLVVTAHRFEVYSEVIVGPFLLFVRLIYITAYLGKKNHCFGLIKVELHLPSDRSFV